MKKPSGLHPHVGGPNPSPSKPKGKVVKKGKSPAFKPENNFSDQ